LKGGRPPAQCPPPRPPAGKPSYPQWPRRPDALLGYAPAPMGRNGSGSSGAREMSASWVGSLPLALPPERAWERFARVEDWPRWDWMGSADARWLAGDPWTV